MSSWTPPNVDTPYWGNRKIRLDIVAEFEFASLFKMYYSSNGTVASPPPVYRLRARRTEPQIGIYYLDGSRVQCAWSPLSCRLMRLRRSKSRTQLEAF